MKGFVEGVTKAVTKVEGAFERAASKTAQHLGDPGNVSQSEVDDAWREFGETVKETESTASGAARDEFKEHILKNMQASGMSRQEAEAWFEGKWVTVKSLADKGIKYAPKAGLAAKALWVAVSAAVVGLVALVVGPGASREGKAFAGVVNRNNRMLDEAEYNLRLAASTEAFLRMGSILNVPSIPPEVFAATAVPEPAAPYLPPAAALPAPVAAIAAQPVQVEVSRDGQTYSGTTDVERVYRAVPEARRDIEQHAGQIQHDYDKPTDRRKVGRDNRYEREHHVNIHVDAGFASVHIRM